MDLLQNQQNATMEQFQQNHDSKYWECLFNDNKFGDIAGKWHQTREEPIVLDEPIPEQEVRGGNWDMIHDYLYD